MSSFCQATITPLKSPSLDFQDPPPTFLLQPHLPAHTGLSLDNRHSFLASLSTSTKLTFPSWHLTFVRLLCWRHRNSFLPLSQAINLNHPWPFWPHPLVCGSTFMVRIQPLLVSDNTVTLLLNFHHLSSPLSHWLPCTPYPISMAQQLLSMQHPLWTL